ncbi:hypothetical protein E4U42_006870 [Claviceps africana]|uniref:BIR-domain-containing protein n=1 Tax=Claviceps africana TaxID=83212 RepID=A0A8K0J1T1_9HYPO|nr:hypothetical protein E4U42_006870 [Claviceps africana]
MDQYFTYEARLSSFQKSSKKRGSTAGGRGRALSWPHKQIAPSSLAKAGFYFEPYAENPDNCACFLCGKGMDGWEAGDDPLHEHLKHSPTCGWAIHAAIEADIEEYSKEDPSLPHMVEGRRATFADKWPHEARKGWKCKTKQLVEAGWNYTPTEESDDMATCAYCQLGLDGWEPNDKPYDEHYNRSPNCSFFALLKQFSGTKKKTARAKATRGSKASRLSVQSVATAASDMASIADTTAEAEDSVLTTTSTLSQGAKRPVSRKKNATTAKAGSKITKSKTSRAVEEEEEEEEEEAKTREKGQEKENEAVHEEVRPQSKPTTKLARGKKRASDAMEDSIIFMAEAPVPKKRAAASRDTSRMDRSTMTPEEDEVVTAPKAAGRGKSSSVGPSGKQSASLASLRAAPEYLSDDEEIERQLEAELDGFTTDDEIAQDSDSARRTAKNKTKKETKKKTTPGTAKFHDYAMFDPGEIETDEQALDQELLTLRAEMEVGEPRQELHIPKKGRKAGTARKASKQTKTKRAPSLSPSLSPLPSSPSLSPSPLPSSSPSPERELEAEFETDQTRAGEDQNEVSIDSTDTVVKKTGLAPSPPTRKPRGRPAKASSASNTTGKLADAPIKRGRGRPAKVAAARSSPSLHSPGPEAEQMDDSGSEMHEDGEEIDTGAAGERTRSPSIARRSTSPAPAAGGFAGGLSRSRLLASRLLAEPPSTPTKVVSPAPSARQPALSPSQSPQSSDAENQPPSSVPMTSSRASRVVLAPVATTPVLSSPTRHTMLAAGLSSQTPWTAIDLDAVMGTPGLMTSDKENAVGSLLKQGKELTSPEKRMTLEEWIHFNAGEAEKKLKHECEAMVTQFEREGTRAMNVLEGLPVE